MPALGLNTQIWNNNLRSLLLLATYPLVLAGTVWVVALLTGAFLLPSGAAYGVAQDSALVWARAARFANAQLWQYWPTVFTVAGIWFIVAYFLQGRMIRALSHARPVTRAEEPALYNLLENLCIAQGMKMPRLEIIETDALNAFASGVDDRSYAVTVTRGLMNRLQPDEVEGVLAHELSHIRHRDVRLLIVSVIFAGMIGFFAQMIWSFIRFNALTGGGGNGQRRNGQVLILLMLVGAVLWIAHMATILTRFALSRRREYMADAGAVNMTKNPDAMMRALMRISGQDRIPAAPDDIAIMCIENSRPFMGLFTTHPPIPARVQAIAALTQTPIPTLTAAAPDENAAANPAANPENPPRHRVNPWIR